MPRRNPAPTMTRGFQLFCRGHLTINDNDIV